MTGESIFPYARWYDGLPPLAKRYAGARPFPHIHLADFFDASVIEQVAGEFAATDAGPWVHYKHYNENKLGMTDRRAFPRATRAAVDELNSDRFLAWLSELTGIEGLLADPTLEGGGLHQSETGGFLNVHADFTMHHHARDWRRRVNVIVYLNPTWQAEWGGALELWDKEMQRAVVRVPPLLNHAVIFNTDECSYHGFPDPITCPAGVRRRSLALYYYTPERRARGARSTDYQPRPGDGFRKTVLIKADKTLVHLYSKVKSTLGLSDRFASRTLGLLNRPRSRKRGAT